MLHSLQQADARLFHWCSARKRRRQLAAASLWISRTGDGPLYVLLGLLVLMLEPAHGRAFFTAALLAYAVDVPLYLLLKNSIKRPRPFVRLQTWHYIMPSDEFSFPSGHTAAATVWAVLIAAFYPVLAPLALCWALCVGASRVFLGVHYPGDILAGMVLGASCAALGLSTLAVLT